MSNAKKSDITKQNDDNKAFSERFLKIVGSIATQDEISKKIGTSRQNVGNWISGKAKPDIYALAKISKAYNVSTDYLLGLTDIQTKDGDTTAFCNVSGITENAATHFLFCRYPDILSRIFECDFFDDFISIINDVFECSFAWVEQAKQNNNVSKIDLDYIDLYRYRAHKIFDLILNEFDRREIDDETANEIIRKTTEKDIELYHRLDKLIYEYYSAVSAKDKDRLQKEISKIRKQISGK